MQYQKCDNCCIFFLDFGTTEHFSLKWLLNYIIHLSSYNDSHMSLDFFCPKQLLCYNKPASQLQRCHGYNEASWIVLKCRSLSLACWNKPFQNFKNFIILVGVATNKTKHFWRKNLEFRRCLLPWRPLGELAQKMVLPYFTQRNFWKIDIKLPIAYFYGGKNKS